MLRDAIDAVIGPARSGTIYDLLTAQATNRVKAGSCALYVLDSSVGAYELRAEVGDTTLPAAVPALPRRRASEAESRLSASLQRALSKHRGSGTSTFIGGSVDNPIIGLLHDRTIYAFLVARGCDDHDDEALADLAAIVKLVFFALQEESSRRALQAQSHPIDITGARADFYAAIARFLRRATGMQFVALRELHLPGDRDLRCTAVAGFRSTDQSDFDLVDYAAHEPFRLAVEQQKPTFSPDRSVKGLERLWAGYPQLRDVQSFAVFPISDGSRVFAVLSVASSCRMDFTDTMKEIIGGVARFVGFTLQNRQLYFEKNDLQSSAIETAVALNVVELFSDLAHQLRNALSKLQDATEVARLATQKSSRAPSETSAYFDTIDRCFDRVSELLHQANDITRVPEAELTREKVSGIWDNALGLVQYRVEKARVTPRLRGDTTIDVYPVLLRQVFFHLLTNSLKAFAERSRLRGGEISLYVHPGRSANSVTLRYVDNAGGINPAQLRNRRRTTDQPISADSVHDAIFQRGVTGSRGGTGYGLWIVRQIVQRHQGSIVLKNYREGVTFDIDLPTNLKELSSRPKEM